MRPIILSAILSTIIPSTFAADAGIQLGPLISHFARDGPPAGFSLFDSASNPGEPVASLSNGQIAKEETIDLRIGLVSNDIPGLEEALKAISTPGNARYQQYLTDDEVDSYVSPSSATKSLLTTWLNSHNLSSITKSLTPAGEWILLPKLPIEQANQLLDADYRSFVNQKTGKVGIRTLKWSIPQALKGHVETVHPGGSFDFGEARGLESVAQVLGSGQRKRRDEGRKLLRRRGEAPSPSGSGSGSPSSSPQTQSISRPSSPTPTPTPLPSSSSSSSPTSSPSTSSTSSSPASCATLVTPTCLQQLYGIPSTPAHSHPNNQLLVTGFGNQFAQKADLQQYLTLLRPDISPSTSFTLVSLDDGSNTQNASQAGSEANLDIQLTVGLATDVPVTFLSVGNGGGSMEDDGLGAFLDVTDYLLGEDVRRERRRPSVVTTSYGFNEPDLDPSAMKKLCNSYLQLSALGTSVIFSSGDGGVSGNGFTSCPDNGSFVPSFPSTCPYVTSVGGTTASTSPETGGSFPNETALFFSSGGFSDVFDRAWFQADQVENYLNRDLGTNYTGLYNPHGRAFPDLSGFSSDIAIVSGGQHVRVGGTSAAAPIFASIVALLNDRLLNAGRAPLGFLNPLIYSGRAERMGAWRDVGTGSNPGCNTTGFEAGDGWDPVTGVGSPDFDGLLKAIGL